MGERVKAAAKARGSEATGTSARAVLQRRAAKPLVNEPGDAHEREADRVADAVANASTSAQRPAFSIGAVPILQRDEKPPGQKSNEEKYLEAAKKLGEAFLQTPPGKEIKEKAEQLGDAFLETLPGKIITGAGLAGAVAALAATHRELPIGIPEISLDKIRPGLKMKITYEGPVDKPKRVMATFSFKFGAGKRGSARKPAQTESEKRRAEVDKMIAEQARFRESLKTPEERERDRRMMDAWLKSRMGVPGGPALSFGVAGQTLGVERAAPLTERPGGVGTGPFAPPDFKLTGETDQKPPQEEEKKKEEGEVQRKAASSNSAAHASMSGAPPVVNDALHSSGQPLDSATRATMEARFGLDFGRVRIHTDAQAAQSAQAVNALAYTVGDEVVFGSGQYSPHTAEGQRLLAHELAHVVQQSGGAAGMALSPAPATLMRKKDADTPEPDPLEVALNGDDDAVRALTNEKDWEARVLRPEDASKLLIHLLDGATLNEDEEAGLRILRKMVQQLMLDDTLSALDKAGRFEQLLDDYHGAQYRDLLKVLSDSMQQKGVKAVYLDAFIAMWWVREHEEKAIVILLERTPLADQFDLLMEKDRLSELRSAIDNDDPRLRYETIVAGVNQQHGEQLKTRLSAILQIDAKASVGKGQRTEKEVNDLLKRAAADLADELLEYQSRLAEAVKEAKGDPGKVTEINKEFEKRLKGLIEAKTAEFGFELKYNIEFNRLLEDAYGRPWKQEDLADFDKNILQKIPPDILHANPKFKAFLRGAEHPKLGGWSSKTKGAIALFGDLNLGTTLHELGHNIHHGDDKLYEKFRELSGWKWLTRSELIKDIADPKKSRELLEDLDSDRENEREYKSRRLGEHFYRYDRYGSGYLRYNRNACFISAYAETDPADDFAESFEEYILQPKRLQDKCPDKYKFMHVDVLAGYRLQQQAGRVLKQFDERVDDSKLSIAPSELADTMKSAYTDPLRAELEAALTQQREEKVEEAEKTVADKPKPVSQTAIAEESARPYLGRLNKLLNVLNPVATAGHAVAGALQSQSIFDVLPSLSNAHADLGERLTTQYRDELLKLVDAPAQRALKGVAVDVRSWPALDALKAKYEQAVGIIPPYLPLYHNAFIMPGLFLGVAFDILKKYSGKKKRDDIRVHLLAQRDNALFPEIEAWKAMVVARIRDGVPFDPKQVEDPKAILGRYETQWQADAAKIAAQRRARNDAEPSGESAADAVRTGVQSPGQPLDADARGFMEERFGADFGAVRVHTGPQAAQSARALNAQAFTVGQDIVFDENAFAPGTREGQALLAHELTHVMQQEGATPATPAAPADEERRELALPALSFDQVDLPQTEPTNEDAGEAVAPAASTAPQASTPEMEPAEAEAATTEVPSAEPPKGENVVAAKAATTHPATTPMAEAGAGASPQLVPPTHPSEQEAERISRAVIAPDAGRWPANAPVTQHSRRGVAQRKPAPPKPQAKPPVKPQGKDIVFIMGVDKNPRKNPFYREAVKYFKATQPGATLVNDNNHRSLESVFDYLRDKGERVANLYLVSHANEDGTLSFKLRNGDKEKEPHVQYGDLNAALTDESWLFNLPKGIIDEDTSIYIKGCNIGRSTRMLDALDKAFGGEGKVIAPTHKQAFGTKVVGKGKDRKVEQYEALKVYFIEYKGKQAISPADQQAAFIAKYPELPEAQWKKWVPVSKKGKGGATRQLISTTYTYKYKINVKNKETKRMAEEEALPKAIEWGEANIGRAEMFEWRIASSKPTGYGWFVTAVAEKTNYVVDKILVDAEGKRLTPPETDPKYFGTSTFGDEAKKTAQQNALGDESDTAALMAELAQLNQALAGDLLPGEERDEKLARRREIEAILKQRNAFVDVGVIKTEDWLGADEVYVQVRGAGQPFTSPMRKLNDGQSGTFTVPLTALMPFDQPVTLEVFDEDLGWFIDRDDLIVKMDWPPPFAEATNKESFDEADYRVRAHL